jgi:hypothetical protein
MKPVIPVVLAVSLLTACSGEPAGAPREAASPTGDPDRWRDAPEQEPYPFVTPIPPLAETGIDGVYTRSLPGSDAIPCRRCAPYRLDSGPATLTLAEGRFTVEQPLSRFTSRGHYFVEGDRILLINDPNCAQTEGVYRWDLRARMLSLEVVEDDCSFDLLRARYFSAAPWAAS